jgi:hypothetical protein
VHISRTNPVRISLAEKPGSKKPADEQKWA